MWSLEPARYEVCLQLHGLLAAKPTLTELSVESSPHNRASCRMRATDVARAAPQKSYHAMRTMLMGTLARAVSTVMTAGAHTMFWTCIACIAHVACLISGADV